MIHLVRLLRPNQWYKNGLIFLPLVFALQFTSKVSILLSVVGFFLLSFISSVNYIINDLKDIDADKNHPEKCRRPVASGKVSKLTAVLTAITLFITSLTVAYQLSAKFFIALLSLFVFTQIYTFALKEEPFADVLMISINFVLRAISGAFLIGVFLSPWLILCPFFLAFFLAVNKRKGDLLLLKDNAIKHKKVLKSYTSETLDFLRTIATTLLIFSYAIYISVSEFPHLFFTLPIVLYLIFRYVYLTDKGSEIARHPNKVVKDWRLLSAGIIFTLLTATAVFTSLKGLSIF